MFQYADDHGGKLPRVCALTASGTENWAYHNSAFRASSAPYQDLRPYLKNDAVLTCPAAPLKCDYDTSGFTPVRYETDYRFNDCLSYVYTNGTPSYLVRAKGLDECRFPKRFYIVSDRHSNHHYENEGSRMSEWVMLMVMADGHLASSVKPYLGGWKDTKGKLKYNHWEFPNCHPTDPEVVSEYN